MTAKSKVFLGRPNVAELDKIPLIGFRLARLIFTAQANHLHMV